VDTLTPLSREKQNTLARSTAKALVADEDDAAVVDSRRVVGLNDVLAARTRSSAFRRMWSIERAYASAPAADDDEPEAVRLW
jgi:hypothetical protein